MPRFAYWTILLGELPTSFRAKQREDLVPTLKQLQRVHRDARLKWFQDGRLWVSPEEAQFARKLESRPKGLPPRTSGLKSRPTNRPAERGQGGRKSAWRPGGEHRDPKARVKVPRDVRRARYRQRTRKRSSE